ncbi:MAG TPA: hypothetical protein PKV55_07355 [Nitrospira sp.]|nr:hypothetical protein [Nitrospira sp.]HMZ98673.1 hypothetical protein [Nitrospira sp.]HNA48900.1 hypothetical protein [Nitrospira sp.]HNA86032.1 hypothetical protein [Nitrospira sp.]HNI67837.1 hypothetical protein [Nitrospira sp.]
MGLETANYIHELNSANPTTLDQKSQGDDHLRLIKAVLKATFPNLTGAMTADQAELNQLDGTTISAFAKTILDDADASAMLTTLGFSAFIKTLLDDADAAAVRTTIGAGVGNALLSAVQTWTAAQRGTITTDNDLSFDLSVTNYFVCTPTAGGTLTFTNIPSGQPVAIKLVNGSNYAIAAHANTKISFADLTRISVTGTYLLTGLADGTNVLLTASANLA